MCFIISQTPLRISLAGGGTDIPSFYEHHEGNVIACAIDKYVYVILKKRFDKLIVLNYSQKEIVKDVDEIKHGIIRECLLLYGITEGIEVTTLSDIPSEGSGLGSSSSITVGLLTALSAYVGYSNTPSVIADLACSVEINYLAKPIGKQDQYIAALGGIQWLVFTTPNRVSSFPREIDYRAIGDNLFLHYTDVTRDANEILSKQQDNAGANTAGLIKLSEYAVGLISAIERQEYNQVGNVLKDSWEIKKTLAPGITNDYLDSMIAESLGAGAIGCKVAGAGGGGFILSYVPPERHTSFKEKMSKYRELPFNIDPRGSRIIFNQ